MPSKDTTPVDIERRYSMATLGRGFNTGGGKYLLYSNDLQHGYAISRYDETGDLSAERTDGTTRVITGTFWRVFWIKPDSGLLIHEGTPGRSRIVGVDGQNLFDAVLDHDNTLVEIASLVRSRNEAVQVALRRYQARQHRIGTHDLWGVHDRVTSSWPSLVAGRKITDHGSGDTGRAKAEADADWLNRNHA